MKVCFLSSMHPPLDKRVFDKEARALAAAGYDVIHLAPGSSDVLSADGVSIVTYREQPPRGLVGRIGQLAELYCLALKLDADAYHCNEVDSWMVGVVLKIFNRRIVVFDVHEHYPSTFAEQRFPAFLQSAVQGFIRFCFRVLSPVTDRFVLAKKTVSGDFRGAEHKQVLVQNFVPLRYDDSLAGNGEERTKPLTAIHVGVVSRLRGWPQMLEAISHAEGEWMLHLVGTFNDGSEDEFNARVENLGLQRRVRVDPWLPFDEMFRCLKNAHAGLVMFQPGIQNHVFALPHKMFDYMLARLPVVAPAFAIEVAEIIEDAECGLLVDSSCPQSVADALSRLYRDPVARLSLGTNGHSAVCTTYNWENEAKKLVEMYRELALG